MKHLSTVSPPINSALVVIVLAIGVTFQIIEALSTAIDSMTWMQNSKTWQAGGPPTIRKDKVFLILSNRFDQKQTLPQNILFASKKYLPWNNTPDLPVARNINNQILIVQQYKQEKITRMIVILKKKKKRKTHFSHLTYWTAQRQRQERKKVAKSMFTHLTMHMHEPKVRTNFRSVHELPSVILLVFSVMPFRSKSKSKPFNR